MTNTSITSTAKVEIFDPVDNNTSTLLTSTVGQLLTQAGLPPAEYYSVDFHEDMGEARVDTIHDEDTNEVLWDGNDSAKWTEKDDLILEVCESYIYSEVM